MIDKQGQTVGTKISYEIAQAILVTFILLSLASLWLTYKQVSVCTLTIQSQDMSQ